MANVRDWAVGLEACVSKTYYVTGRTPEEAQDVAEQNFHDEYGDDLNIEDITGIAVPAENEDSLESEEFEEEEFVEL